MEFSIKLNEQDICATKPETVASLFMVLREISCDSRKLTEQKADKMVDTVVNTHHKAQAKTPVNVPKASETTKVSPDGETTAKNGSEKATEADTKTTEAAPEPKNDKPAPAEEPKTEETAAPAEKVDREAISARVKEIAFNGKAEGKPKKIKALLQEYGVEKLPDLPDDKMNEFLEKVEAL